MAESGSDDLPEAPAMDAEVAHALARMGDAPYRDLESLPLDQAIAHARFVFDLPPPPNSEDRIVPAAEGREVRVRLYFPDEERASLPLLMYLHGGGFVAGTVEMDDARCVMLSQQAGCVVASVDYPLAPEHRFPTAIEDAFAAWQWLSTSAEEFGGDPGRAAISGSSAGGHLAIGVCLLARNRGAVMPALQLLTYPVVDPALDSGSYQRFAGDPFLTQARMAWYWKQYKGDGEPQGPLWSPLGASLAGLPPAHVITAEFDVLRDEAEVYAERLREESVPATATRYPGMIHGFIAVLPQHRQSAAAIAECATVLREVFANG